MSPERQRIVIAEMCGWNHVSEGPCPYGITTRYHGTPSEVEVCVPIPDYLNDLNAMHEAEEQLKVSGNYSGYIGHLKTIVSGGVALCVHATAAQRAEAFLRTLNKWEESL